MTLCKTCKKELNDPERPYESDDCGGDCRMCMAIYGEDIEQLANLINFYNSDFYIKSRRWYNLFQDVSDIFDVLTPTKRVDLFLDIKSCYCLNCGQRQPSMGRCGCVN